MSTMEELQTPFEEIRWRVDRSQMSRQGEIKVYVVPYIDARDVMDRLDAVLGPAGWWDEYIPHDKGFLCKLTLVLGDQEVTKMDAGEFTNFAALKGGISDSFKRAAVKFGIARYLYEGTEALARINPDGKYGWTQVKPPKGSDMKARWVRWDPPDLSHLGKDPEPDPVSPADEKVAAVLDEEIY